MESYTGVLLWHDGKSKEWAYSINNLLQTLWIKDCCKKNQNFVMISEIYYVFVVEKNTNL